MCVCSLDPLPSSYRSLCLPSSFLLEISVQYATFNEVTINLIRKVLLVLFLFVAVDTIPLQVLQTTLSLLILPSARLKYMY